MDVGLLSEAGFCIPTLGYKHINYNNETTTVSLRQLFTIIAGAGQENAGCFNSR